jgi:hypothetical protein
LPAIDIDHKPVSANDVHLAHTSPQNDPGFCFHLYRSREAVRSGLNSRFRLCADDCTKPDLAMSAALGTTSKSIKRIALEIITASA